MKTNVSEKINVMVTGVGGGGHGEQILKALKMAETKYTIIGADMSPVSLGLMEVDHPCLLPPASDENYITMLLAICKQYNVKVLFHGCEPELIIMSKMRSVFEKKGIFLPINPANVIDTCMDKSKTMEFLKNNNFNCPETFIINSTDDLSSIKSFPVILKPYIGGGGSANTFIAQSKDELMNISRYLLNSCECFMVQEYVGRSDSEFTIGVLISMDGKLLNSIAVKRHILTGINNRLRVVNRTEKSELGQILAISNGFSQGEIGRFPEVTEQAEKIALSLGCRGVVNIQCRLVKEDIFVFEINPRFSGTTSLRAMVGYNEPDILIRNHLFGEQITPHFAYDNGTIVRGIKEVLINNNSLDVRGEPHDQ